MMFMIINYICSHARLKYFFRISQQPHSDSFVYISLSATRANMCGHAVHDQSEFSALERRRCEPLDDISLPTD
jgi:hypothetical protein